MNEYSNELRQLILSANYVWVAMHDVNVGHVSLKQQLITELSSLSAQDTEDSDAHNWRHRAVRRHLSSSKELVLFVSGLPQNLEKYKYTNAMDMYVSTKDSSVGPVFASLGCLFITFTNGYSASISYQMLREQKQDGKLQCVSFIPYIALPANTASDYNPLLVFVNLKSGGGQGKRVLEILNTILNPHQIFSLGVNGPMPGLYAFRKLKRFRILVCGGDGTVGWVLSTLELAHRYMTCKEPPIAVMPLGTGNDLARVLGYGPGWNGESIPNFLAQVQEAQPVKLDRWTIFFDTSPNTTPVHKAKNNQDKMLEKEEATVLNVTTTVEQATSGSYGQSNSENDSTDSKVNIVMSLNNDKPDSLPPTSSKSDIDEALNLKDISEANEKDDGIIFTEEETNLESQKSVHRKHHILSASDLDEEKLRALNSQESEENCEPSVEEDSSRNEEAISGLILKKESEHLTFIPSTVAMKEQKHLLSMLREENPAGNSEPACTIHTSDIDGDPVNSKKLFLKSQSTINNNIAAKTVQVQQHRPLSRTDGDMVPKNRTMSEIEEASPPRMSIGQQGKKLSLPILSTPQKKTWNGSIDESILKSLEEEDTNGSTSKASVGGPKTVTMNSYMGMGIDADLSLAFHLAREENPEKFSSRFHNKAIYFKAGVKKMTSRSKQLSSVIDLEVDGNKINLPSIKGLLFLNITSWGSGANAWGSNTSRRFQMQDMGDNMIEIIGLSGVAHMSQVYSGLRSGIRIAQGEYIRIKLWSEIAIQVDGEPWVQPPGDIVITVSPMEVFMLKRQKKKK